VIGQTILHYKITDKLGAGGMGEVYLAHDERLDRQVALKFLPAHVQSEATSRERFLREAQAASKLTHPNIVGLYYIEQVDDRDFIVMEYVRGRSLRDVIAEGDISLEKALGWTREIAGALSAAHAQGIVHRDIKAENIIITDNGHAKVLDFGLAKVEGATQITDSTSTVGTLAYMSPEQTRGEEVDARADLFSLGVLFYELITGKQPFRGDHRAAILYAIINETPEPLARYKTDVSDDIQRIADKALRKKKETRYQSAAGMVADIDALVAPSSSVISAPVTPARSRPAWVRFTGIALIVFLIGTLGFLLSRQGGEEISSTEPPPTPSTAAESETDSRTMIAVLPFENLGAPDDAYFADGITEEITARLARIKELGVIARTSVLRYKETELQVDQIGAELGVDYILEGTVRWQRAEGEQSRVRVTPQLIKVADATHVWADVFDEPLTAVTSSTSRSPRCSRCRARSPAR
jgi:serine/threonine protein kinase